MIYPQLPKAQKSGGNQLALTHNLYGSQNMYEKLYQNVPLDPEFQRVDQENKKELLAIRDKERDAGRQSSAINLRTASCAEKQAYYSDMLKSAKDGLMTTKQINQLGLNQDLYYKKRMMGGKENFERLMK